MDRQKMSRENRAKQFAPFDALKGLHEALKVKEYEHDKMQKGNLTEEEVAQISNTLLSISKGDNVQATYFCDGYEKTICGPAKVNFDMQELIFENATISFDDLIRLNKN